VKAGHIAGFELRTAIAGAAFALAALVVVVACSTANMTTYAAVDERTKFSEDTLYRAARDAAEELGLAVTAGEGSATFDTREKEVATSGVPRLSYKFTFHVETTGGNLVIRATCMKNSSMSEDSFSDCGDDRPERVVKLQAALRKRTLERAKTDESKSPDFTGFGEPEKDDADAGKPAAKGSDKAAPSDAKSKDAKGKDDAKADDAKGKAKPKASAKKK
jgi:hypothetical protein